MNDLTSDGIQYKTKQDIWVWVQTETPLLMPEYAGMGVVGSALVKIFVDFTIYNSHIENLEKFLHLTFKASDLQSCIIVWGIVNTIQLCIYKCRFRLYHMKLKPPTFRNTTVWKSVFWCDKSTFQIVLRGHDLLSFRLMRRKKKHPGCYKHNVQKSASMTGWGCVSAHDTYCMWWHIKKVQLQPAEQLYISHIQYARHQTRIVQVLIKRLRTVQTDIRQ